MSWSWTNNRAWAGAAVSINPATNPAINCALSTQDYMFVCPFNGRLRKSSKNRTLVLQSGEGEAIDTYLDENAATTNHGKSKLLYVGKISTKEKRPLIKFDLSQIPTGATITKAVFTFHVNTITGAKFDLNFNRILNNTRWTEMAATWNTQDGTNAWAGDATSKGCTVDTTDFAAAELGTATGANVTTGVNNFTLDNTEFGNMLASNLGFVIGASGGGTDRYYAIASSADPDTNRRPKLVVEYTTTGDWTVTGGSTSAGDYQWMLIHNGNVWAGKRASNRVHYSNSATLSTLDGTITDTNSIVVGVGGKTLGAIVYAGTLYVAKPDGLWTIGDDKIARRVLDFSTEASDDNFRSMVVWNGYLVFPIRDRLYQWNAARLAVMTPPKVTDAYPYTSYGRFDNLLCIGDYLYCTGRTNETTYYERLLCYDGVGWFSLADLVTDGVGNITNLSYDSTLNYLWLHISNGETQTTYYIPFQSCSSFPYADFPTSGSHQLFTSRLDMGYRRVTKSTPSILISASNLSSAHYYIDVYYSLDGAAFVKWGSITAAGTTELTFTSSATIEYNWIQLRFDFITDNAAQTPVLEEFVLRFLLRPATKYAWNMNIIAATNMEFNGMADERSSRTIITDLEAARDSKAPVAFVDELGVTYKCYVTAVSENFIERTGDVVDGINDLELYVNLNLLQV
jgi:hypothetical protein